MFNSALVRPTMLGILRESGWYEGRCVDLSMLEEKCRKEDVILFDAAKKFLMEFSGLKLCFYQADGRPTIFGLPRDIYHYIGDDCIFMNQIREGKNFEKYAKLATYPVVHYLRTRCGEFFDVSNGDVQILFDDQEEQHFFLDEIVMDGVVKEPCFTVGDFSTSITQVSYNIILTQSNQFWFRDNCEGKYRLASGVEEMLNFLLEHFIDEACGRVYTKCDREGQKEAWLGLDQTNRQNTRFREEIREYCRRHGIELMDTITYLNAESINLDKIKLSD